MIIICVIHTFTPALSIAKHAELAHSGFAANLCFFNEPPIVLALLKATRSTRGPLLIFHQVTHLLLGDATRTLEHLRPTGDGRAFASQRFSEALDGQDTKGIWFFRRQVKIDEILAILL